MPHLPSVGARELAMSQEKGRGSSNGTEEGGKWGSADVKGRQAAQGRKAQTIPMLGIGSGHTLALQGEVSGQRCQMVIDTGAAVTVIREDLAEVMEKKETSKCLCTATGEPIRVAGTAEATIKLRGGLEFTHPVIIADIREPCLLGLDFLASKGCVVDLKRGNVQIGKHKLKTIPYMKENGIHAVGAQGQNQLSPALEDLLGRASANLTKEQKRALRDLVSEFQDVFAEGVMQYGAARVPPHKINTKGHEAIRQAPRRLAPIKRPIVDKLIDEMQRAGVIEPSESPWASPIVLVAKKDGSTRFCVDYRKLNAITEKDAHPLPKTDELLNGLKQGKWFSTLDFHSGYWQIPMAEDDKEKTAFCTPSGLWQFKVMPFGLTNAPATFQRTMTKLLWRLLKKGWVLVYIDDVLVLALSVEQHLELLRELFELLREANMKLNIKKTTLLQTTATYLGHIVTPEGVKTDQKKLAVIQDWPTPTTTKEVRAFTGFCGYYKDFIQHFADKMKPLYQAENQMPFEWTREHEVAFTNMKEVFMHPPVLGHVKDKAPFIIDADASNVAIGATLSQVQDGQERVISYFSKCLSRPERNYCVTRRELLSVVRAVEHFAEYGIANGLPLTIRTDHASLKWLMNFKKPDGQMARWFEILAPYAPTIVYRPGKEHGNADGLSRRPCLLEQCKYCARREDKEEEQLLLRCQLVDTWGKKECGNAQRQDPTLRKVVGWVERRERARPEELENCSPEEKAYDAMFASLVLIEGCLHRKWESPEGRSIAMQMVVPPSWRKTLFEQVHNLGHFGESRTAKAIRRNHYWVGIHRDIATWCRTCHTCQERTQGRRRAPLRVRVSGVPFERVGLDLMGPLPLSNRGNRYILTLQDYFTKWPEALALPDNKASTVARALVDHVVSRFGVPHEIHSDQGRSFEGEVFQAVVQLLGVHKTRATPLHPQSDGLVERLNRTLWQLLSKMVSDGHQRDWDDMLPVALLAYRASEHSTTGFSPARMMFGRELNLPVHLLIGARPAGRTVPEYVEELQRSLSEVHEVARKRLKLQAEDMRRRYNLRAKKNEYREGDRVWFYNPRRRKGILPKLQRSWEGPCTVVTVLNDVVFRIRTTKGQLRIVHHDRLSPFIGDGAVLGS